MFSSVPTQYFPDTCVPFSIFSIYLFRYPCSGCSSLRRTTAELHKDIQIFKLPTQYIFKHCVIDGSRYHVSGVNTCISRSMLCLCNHRKNPGDGVVCSQYRKGNTCPSVRYVFVNRIFISAFDDDLRKREEERREMAS